MAPKVYLSEADRNRDLKKGSAGKGPTKVKVVKSAQAKAVGQKVRKNSSPKVIQPTAANIRAPNNRTGKNTRSSNGKPALVTIKNARAKPVNNKAKPAPRQPALRQAASVAQPKVVHQKQIVSSYRGVIGGNPQIAMARETAAAIARNNSHPHCKEVLELLRTHEKGWVDDQKFVDILQTLLF